MISNYYIDHGFGEDGYEEILDSLPVDPSITDTLRAIINYNKLTDSKYIQRIINIEKYCNDLSEFVRDTYISDICPAATVLGCIRDIGIRSVEELEQYLSQIHTDYVKNLVRIYTKSSGLAGIFNNISSQVDSEKEFEELFDDVLSYHGGFSNIPKAYIRPILLFISKNKIEKYNISNEISEHEFDDLLISLDIKGHSANESKKLLGY